MNTHPLIATLVGAFVSSFLFGMVARRIGVAPIVGFLLAGVVIGPFTPGFVADLSLAPELAEIGVVLLMFGVGLHFSIGDLMAVRRIAIPGATVQIVLATLLGWALAHYGLHWSHSAGLMFGLSLSTASTVVLVRALEDRRLLTTHEGRIAVGWLIVEDLAMVLALVLVPVFSDVVAASTNHSGLDATTLVMVLATTIGKVGMFVALMLIVGRRVIPWSLDMVSKTASRELFTLAVLTIALGVAFGSAQLFGVSFALGAFFAGLILNESQLGHKAAADTLPLRDAFAVLFFVSVGMLFDPSIVMRHPWAVATTLLIIVVGKSVAAWLIVLAFGHPRKTALIISASLAQIGEFAFMLAQLVVTLGLLSIESRDIILAGAILSIIINPLLFAMLDQSVLRADRATRTAPPVGMKDHVVLVGHGRVGSLVGEALRRADHPLVVIEENEAVVHALQAANVPAVLGRAETVGILESANVAHARLLICAIPHVFEAGQVIDRAHSLSPSLQIIARAHSDAEVEHLTRHGADLVIMGEREIARRMIESAVPDRAIRLS
ncbi:MAG TPA: YbaL family putative K(+) efflux transporter [Nitrospiraceae bacterium]|nr:YbaL family putative K(+) efflux transporter [Nitrospiraceae bacterium]